MKKPKIEELIAKYNWQPWVKRPFSGFIMSTFAGGSTKQAFKKIGLPGWECDFLLNHAEWYSSERAYARTKPVVIKWLKNHSFKEISKRLESSHKSWVKEVSRMARKPTENNNKKLKILGAILNEITTYVWAVHAAEEFFTPLLKKATGKVIKKDVEKFIGDASFPSKHNALEQMVEEYKHGVSPKTLAKKYGWMRARDGFSEP